MEFRKGILWLLVFGLGSLKVALASDERQDAKHRHLNKVPREWSSTQSFDAYEPADFDAYWMAKLKSLPAPNADWNGGKINIGHGRVGIGEIVWGAETGSGVKSAKHPQGRTGF